MIEKIERIAFLLDFYGGLLTGKQQQCLDLHYNQDLSLAEIAETFGVSRQAVHDILKRAENVLDDYEARLGLVKRFNRNRDDLSLAIGKLQDIAAKMSVSGDMSMQAEIEDIRRLMEKIIEQQ